MVKDDFSKFLVLIKKAYIFYGKDCSEETVELYFSILTDYEFNRVDIAFTHHFKTCNRFPSPADIIANIPNDGSRHPTENEAWVIAVKMMDESNTVLFTQEIIDAYSFVRDLYHSGAIDPARMAFREHYRTCLVGAGKPKWRLSLGHCKAKRAEKINRAVMLGIYNHEEAFLETGFELPGLDYSGVKQKLLSAGR